MVWLDESGFEDEQYAQLELDGTALMDLLNQNVAHWDFFETDSAYLSYVCYGVNLSEPDYHQVELNLIIDNETFYSQEDTICNLKFSLNSPLCPTDSNIKVYHVRFHIGFETYSRVGIAPHSKQIIEPYPNPTKDWLYGLGKDEKRLYNAQGQWLLSSHAERLNLSPYPPGVYLLYQHQQMNRILKY